MLKIKEVVEELDSHLDSNGLYYKEEDEADEINAQVLSAWRSKFEEALKLDFSEQLQQEIFLSNSHFELLGDQGATIWTSKITVIDDTTPEKLGIWLRAIVNHKLIKVKLDETSIRQGNYSGTNTDTRALFGKLMKAQENGYSSEISIKECLSS